MVGGRLGIATDTKIELLFDGMVRGGLVGVEERGSRSVSKISIVRVHTYCYLLLLENLYSEAEEFERN